MFTTSTFNNLLASLDSDVKNNFSESGNDNSSKDLPQFFDLLTTTVKNQASLTKAPIPTSITESEVVALLPSTLNFPSSNLIAETGSSKPPQNNFSFNEQLNGFNQSIPNTIIGARNANSGGKAPPTETMRKSFDQKTFPHGNINTALDGLSLFNLPEGHTKETLLHTITNFEDSLSNGQYSSKNSLKLQNIINGSGGQGHNIAQQELAKNLPNPQPLSLKPISEENVAIPVSKNADSYSLFNGNKEGLNNKTTVISNQLTSSHLSVQDLPEQANSGLFENHTRNSRQSEKASQANGSSPAQPQTNIPGKLSVSAPKPDSSFVPVPGEAKKRMADKTLPVNNFLGANTLETMKHRGTAITIPITAAPQPEGMLPVTRHQEVMKDFVKSSGKEPVEINSSSNNKFSSETAIGQKIIDSLNVEPIFRKIPDPQKTPVLNGQTENSSKNSFEFKNAESVAGQSNGHKESGLINNQGRFYIQREISPASHKIVSEQQQGAHKVATAANEIPALAETNPEIVKQTQWQLAGVALHKNAGIKIINGGAKKRAAEFTTKAGNAEEELLFKGQSAGVSPGKETFNEQSVEPFRISSENLRDIKIDSTIPDMPDDLSNKGIEHLLNGSSNKAPTPTQPVLPVLTFKTADQFSGKLAGFIQQRFQNLLQNSQSSRQDILLRLKPVGLGVMRLHLSINDHQLVGKIETSQTETAALLQQHQPQLMSRLQEFGVQIQDFTISYNENLADHHSSKRNGFSTKRKPQNNLKDDLELENISPVEQQSISHGVGGSLDVKV